MASVERRALLLRVWAMRATDKANGVFPARGDYLGDLSDFRVEFGFRPRSWDVAYAHVLATMRAEGVE